MLSAEYYIIDTFYPGGIEGMRRIAVSGTMKTFVRSAILAEDMARA